MKNVAALLLLTLLLFTACAERGYITKPIHTTMPSKPVTLKVTTQEKMPLIKTKKLQLTIPKIDTVVTKTDTVQKTKNIPDATHIATEVKEIKESSLFNFSEDTKNKISGFIIVLIGIIILL